MERNKQEQSTKVNKRALKTAIIISWIVLAVCFVIKLFGGNWFEIATSNGTFSKVCAFVDNHLWLQDIIAFCTSLLATILLNLAVLKRKFFTLKQFIVVLAIDIVSFAFVILCDFINNNILNIFVIVSSIVPMCICPMILSKKVLRSIIAYVLYMTFQAISVVIKGLAITKVNSDSSFVALIFTIDVYVMLILYYLHANFGKDNKNKTYKKGGENNG